jgi:hypothetical protein
MRIHVLQWQDDIVGTQCRKHFGSRVALERFRAALRREWMRDPDSETNFFFTPDAFDVEPTKAGIIAALDAASNEA